MNNEGGYDSGDGGANRQNPAWVLGGMWALLFFSTFLVAGPWAGFHGVLLAVVGFLMLLGPPVVSLPRIWWILAAVFGVAGSAAFLPAAWFIMPEWRGKLEALGVNTGSMVAIQARQAAEAFALFVITLIIGLWLAGHRPSSLQARVWALAFTIGVAVYAIISRMKYDPVNGDGLYGFFPNRNHTATYLAMGTICGLGNVLQAIRDRRFLTMSIALAATAVCLWAVAGWSVSRGGVVLVVIGCLLWIPTLGTRYLGKHGLWALGLIGLAGAGLFWIADSGVKDRLSKTMEKASHLIGQPQGATEEGKPEVATSYAIDFRIPTALDTLDLIRAFKWTGIGAGQYYYVFPQYKNRTAGANDSDSYHPESDWLWMAAEAGVPATLALAALVFLACSKSLVAIRIGRDRALRGACLVAALLVPIHGFFDVPGHRISLAISAALLFSLSLRHSSTSTSTATPRAWPFRIAALILLAVACIFVRAQWWDSPKPAITTSKAALEKARELYGEDQKFQKAAEAKGEKYQPDPSVDRLEKALAILRNAEPVAPLDRSLWSYRSFLAFHFDDKYDLVDRGFAIQRALDPTWVAGPMMQAEAWAAVDSRRTAELWGEALERAARLDRIQPGSDWSKKRTLLRIQQFAKGKPDLELLLPGAR